MFAFVAVELLNVRSIPASSGRILGALRKGEVISVDEGAGGWQEIPYNNVVGYVAGSYLDRSVSAEKVIGIVDAGCLNVRSEPSSQSRVLGSIFSGMVVSPLGLMPNWIEIEFNGALGYVAGEFVKLHIRSASYVAKVTVAKLNVRVHPSVHSSSIGCLTFGQPAFIATDIGNWCEISFGGTRAYVAKAHISRCDEVVAAPAHADGDDENEIIPVARDAYHDLLCPTLRLPVEGDGVQQNVALVWNKYGAVLNLLSSQHGIDVACAVAVLCVESSGKGFEQDNANRMIIRFENHKFWHYWGSENQVSYSSHFQHDARTRWKGHRWRPTTTESWRTFHGDQRAEWQVFEFAKSLHAEASLLSISMGAPQIMGFHFQRLGYESVTNMFDDLSSGMGRQIRALFRFFSPAMLAHLRSLNFVAFAAQYNGTGQKEVYGGRIEQHYRRFKGLTQGAILT